MKTKTAEIIKKYRTEKGLSQEAVAAAINDAIIGGSFARQNVSQWENGEVVPNYFFVLALYMKAENWLSDMALELLKAMKPELY